MASAWHHRSDALSSVVALGGVGGAYIGVSPLLDPLAGMIVSFMIGKVGVEAAYDAVKVLKENKYVLFII
jgi:divalent metal cation (Fe/Co/Zn/Cd) transporter